LRYHPALCSFALWLALGVAAGTAHATDPAPPASEQHSWVVPSLHALGLMSTMRLSEAYLWPDPFAETDRYRIAGHYDEAFTQPPQFDASRPLFREDGDAWYINVVGHGLFGSELYLRARTCRKPAWQALLFTGVASTAWEYGFEASGVKPSGLDLMFTPVAGLVLGEARYWAWSGARALPRGLPRSVLSAVFDPLGDIERALGSPC
jgi:hypothetical protein